MHFFEIINEPLTWTDVNYSKKYLFKTLNKQLTMTDNSWDEAFFETLKKQ